MNASVIALLVLALLAAALLDALVTQRRGPALRLGLAAVVLLLMLVPFSGVSLAQRVRGISGDPSLLTSLFAFGYWAWSLGLDKVRSARTQIACLALLISVFAAFFYPLALGATFVDPYGHGYYPTVLSALLLSMIIAAVLSGWWLWVIALAVAYAGYAAHVLESDNLWDYLLDPLLVVIAVTLIVTWRQTLATLDWRSLFPRRFTIGALIMISVFLGFALALSILNPDAFDNEFTVEDGFVEWMTSIALFIAFLYGVRRFFRSRERFGWQGKAILIFVAVVALFGAGEEISWGQRVFGIETPETIRARNAQEEFNLHNLTFEWRGETIKINRLVFGRGMTLALITYLLIMGPLYRRREGFRRFIDSRAIPMATTTQTVAYIAIVAIVELLIDSPKRGEMTEFAGATVFMLNVLFPYNRAIFGETWGRNLR